MSPERVTRRLILKASGLCAASALLPGSAPGEAGIGTATLARVDAFWAAYFGVSPEDFHRPRTVVPGHELGVLDYVAVAFRRSAACVVGVPRTWLEVDRPRLCASAPDAAFDPLVLSRAFSVPLDAVSDTCLLRIASPETFRPVRSEARRIEAADRKALEDFAGAVGHSRWVLSRVGGLDPFFGLFRRGTLVSVAGYRELDGTLAYFGTLTRPDLLGRGYAKSVTSVALDHAFRKGLIPTWWGRESDAPGLATARSLGFRDYAASRKVQLYPNEF